MSITNIQDSSERNYTAMLNSAGKDVKATENLSKKYGITYTTEDNSSLSVDDFFTLMITQLSNQDFMNPTDDSEFMTQMTQFASLKAMQEMAQFTQQNFAMSLLGKTVTATKYSNGTKITETGVVESMSKKDNEYQVTVNGHVFTMNEVSEVSVGNSAASADSESYDPSEALG